MLFIGFLVLLLTYPSFFFFFPILNSGFRPPSSKESACQGRRQRRKSGRSPLGTHTQTHSHRHTYTHTHTNSEFTDRDDLCLQHCHLALGKSRSRGMNPEASSPLCCHSPPLNYSRSSWVFSAGTSELYHCCFLLYYFYISLFDSLKN